MENKNPKKGCHCSEVVVARFDSVVVVAVVVFQYVSHNRVNPSIKLDFLRFTTATATANLLTCNCKVYIQLDFINLIATLFHIKVEHLLHVACKCFVFSYK